MSSTFYIDFLSLMRSWFRPMTSGNLTRNSLRVLYHSSLEGNPCQNFWNNRISNHFSHGYCVWFVARSLILLEPDVVNINFFQFMIDLFDIDSNGVTTFISEEVLSDYSTRPSHPTSVNLDDYNVNNIWLFFVPESTAVFICCTILMKVSLIGGDDLLKISAPKLIQIYSCQGCPGGY